ncbi:phosphate ABC transporter permease [Phormidium tenue FACHB-886]|nr:phosphate ABC transporter permease [Phormidium tenue FACHB-886]
MLIPLTRQKFEELIPRVATGDQYKHAWGKLPDFLRRLLISVAGVVAASILQLFLGDDLWWISFTLGFGVAFYWLWSPVYFASRRNLECRSYRYSGFWQGRVLDRFVSEELVGKEETVNKLGELVIVENRERRLNLIVGDKGGFETKLLVPLKREHRAIRVGDIAEMVVMSSRPDLSLINKVSDVYLPECNLWISDYPYLRHDAFLEMSKEIGQRRRDRRR